MAGNVETNRRDGAIGGTRRPPTGAETARPSGSISDLPIQPAMQIRAQPGQQDAGPSLPVRCLALQSVQERHRIRQARHGIEETGTTLPALIGQDVKTIGAGMRANPAPAAEHQTTGMGLPEFGMSERRVRIVETSRGLGQGADAVRRIHRPAQMAARGTRCATLLGRVPNLDHLDLGGEIPSAAKPGQGFGGQPVQLPSSQACQRQRTKDARRSGTGGEHGPPPETTRRHPEIALALAHTAKVAHAQSLEVHGVQVTG